MDKYIPKMYKKSILDVNYAKLKKNNIKCLLFDLDNTLLEVNKDTPNKNICNLIKKLKKDFTVIIISNNNSEKRLSKASSVLDVSYVKFALKPFQKGFNKVVKDYGFEKDDMCIIGDQIMTDVLGGNKFGIYTVLVDPLTKEELKITGVNRFLENKVLTKLKENNLFNKGEYYE